MFEDAKPLTGVELIRSRQDERRKTDAAIRRAQSLIAEHDQGIREEQRVMASGKPVCDGGSDFSAYRENSPRLEMDTTFSDDATSMSKRGLPSSSSYITEVNNLLGAVIGGT